MSLMTMLSLTVACPECGSKEIVYSCDPGCCFNHVCSACLSSFELSTRDLGENSSTVELEPDDKDPCAPTVACARCKSLAVYMADDTTARLFCASCHAVLELEVSSE